MALKIKAATIIICNAIVNLHVALATETVNPLIFTGGVGASMLQANLNKTSPPHWYCDTQAVGYDLWLYYTNLAPLKADCWLDNMRLRWQDGNMQDAGIEIRLVGDHLEAGDDIKNG